QAPGPRSEARTPTGRRSDSAHLEIPRQALPPRRGGHDRCCRVGWLPTGNSGVPGPAGRWPGRAVPGGPRRRTGTERSEPHAWPLKTGGPASTLVPKTTSSSLSPSRNCLLACVSCYGGAQASKKPCSALLIWKWICCSVKFSTASPKWCSRLSIARRCQQLEPKEKPGEEKPGSKDATEAGADNPGGKELVRQDSASESGGERIIPSQRHFTAREVNHGHVTGQTFFCVWTFEGGTRGGMVERAAN